MIILAKQGTELEQVFKKFYDQMNREREMAANMVKEFTGVKPVGFSYTWAFGITCWWTYNGFTFPEKSKPQNMIPYNDHAGVLYKPNKRLKATKEFINKWDKTFRGINGKGLSEYGIPVMDNGSGRYVHWKPVLRKDRYGIVVPSSLLDRMPKIENKQYEIEL